MFGCLVKGTHLNGALTLAPSLRSKKLNDASFSVMFVEHLPKICPECQICFVRNFFSACLPALRNKTWQPRWPFYTHMVNQPLPLLLCDLYSSNTIALWLRRWYYISHLYLKGTSVSLLFYSLSYFIPFIHPHWSPLQTLAKMQKLPGDKQRGKYGLHTDRLTDRWDYSIDSFEHSLVVHHIVRFFICQKIAPFDRDHDMRLEMASTIASEV